MSSGELHPSLKGKEQPVALTDVHRRFLSAIDLGSARVVRRPDLVLLCGGKLRVDEGEHPSCRSFFHAFLKESGSEIEDRVLLAEQVLEYFALTQSYRDLLTFERDLAHMCLLTILFIESPGSIAELGSFSVLNEINAKLLVIIHQQYANKQTFIWRGPVAYIEECVRPDHAVSQVMSYHWERSPVAFDDADSLLEDVEGICGSYPRSTAFEVDNPAHAMLLILELLAIQRLATRKEIREQMSYLFGSNVEYPVARWLELLEALGLIEAKRYRGMDYLHPTDEDQWVSLGFVDSASPRDMGRWRSELVVALEEAGGDKFKALKARARQQRAESDA